MEKANCLRHILEKMNVIQFVEFTTLHVSGFQLKSVESFIFHFIYLF